MDPPLLDVFSGDQRDSTIPLYLSSQSVTDIKDADITIQCRGFPDQSLFSVGTVNKDTLHVRAADFGDVLFMPPIGYTGNFSLRITSFLSIADSSEKSTRESTISLSVKHPVSGTDRKNFEKTYFGSGIHLRFISKAHDSQGILYLSLYTVITLTSILKKLSTCSCIYAVTSYE